MTEELRPITDTATARLYAEIFGNWRTMIVYVYAELGIADLLSARPKTAEELAQETSTDAVALRRVLDCATVVGLHAAADETGRLVLTTMGKLLCSDAPGSLRSVARLNGAPYRYRPWGRLLEYVRSGSGEGLSPTWEHGSLAYLRSRPELLTVFEDAMSELGRNTPFAGDEDAAIAQLVDFSRFESVVDIGGGTGRLIASIVTAYPQVAGVVFDLPETIERARGQLEAGAKIALIDGDYFRSVPEGHDAYLLKNVLHNHSPVGRRRVLASIRKAMGSSRPGSRLLLFELVQGTARGMTTLADLNLSLLVGGGTEPLAAYEGLLAEAGFRLRSAAPVPGCERYCLEASLLDDPDPAGEESDDE